MTEHRDRQRMELRKLAFAKLNDYARGGLLKNISASGACLEFVYPTGEAEHSFLLGVPVEIQIEGFDGLVGNVNRISRTGIAVEFDEDTRNENELIAEIMSNVNKVPLDTKEKRKIPYPN
jgi:hypothetical protein